MARNSLVEHEFRLALSNNYGVSRLAKITQDFIDTLPDKDRKAIERLFGVEAPFTFAEPADITFVTSGRLEEIEEKYMKRRGVVDWDLGTME